VSVNNQLLTLTTINGILVPSSKKNKRTEKQDNNKTTRQQDTKTTTRTEGKKKTLKKMMQDDAR
jgi:hypothetical protein